MPQGRSSSYESEMPNSWYLFTSRVDANAPTDRERDTAHELIRTGWFTSDASTYDRATARKEFEDGMRFGFKDRAYRVNWTVWRSEYKGRHYPPGSFDPENPPEDDAIDDSNDPLSVYRDDPNRPRWMTPERWRDELKRQKDRDARQLRRDYKKYDKGNIGEPIRKEEHPFYNPRPEPSPWAKKKPEKGYWRPKFGFPFIKHVKPFEEDK